jgi:hypothetical protein
MVFTVSLLGFAYIFTGPEWLTIIHGMLLGGLFVVALAGTLVGLSALRPGLLTPEGRVRLERALQATAGLALVAGWAVVLVGTLVIDPLFHGGSAPPAHFLESYSGTVRWVTWAMPAKENLAWMSVILATATAMPLLTRSESMFTPTRARTVVLVLLSVALVFAGVAALLGVFLNKVGPIV